MTRGGWATIALGLAAGLVGGSAVLAQSGGPYSLRGGITGGGGTSLDAKYRLTGSVGEPVSGTLVGLTFTIDSGSLAVGSEKTKRIIPAIARD